jgi:hypothetical protein
MVPKGSQPPKIDLKTLGIGEMMRAGVAFSLVLPMIELSADLGYTTDPHWGVWIHGRERVGL